MSYIPVEEAAHSVGRAVHAVNDDSLKAQVIAEAQLDLRAIHSAEIGDYTGRARQAVLVSRSVAMPEQVSKADAMLDDELLGCRALFTDVDPTAAAIAAAHWLQAAADVVGELEDIDPTGVVIEADNIEAMPIESTSAVLDRLPSGETPREVVVDLIGAAMQVATGEIPDPDVLVGEIQAARRRLRQLRALSRGEDVKLEPLRASVLDPRRPSRDLLEDLLEGIRGCWLLYQRRGEDSDDDLECEEDLDDELDEVAAEAQEERMTAAFCDEVRAEAATQRDRLSLDSE